jgi:hypothetical protein
MKLALQWAADMLLIGMDITATSPMVTKSLISNSKVWTLINSQELSAQLTLHLLLYQHSKTFLTPSLIRDSHYTVDNSEEQDSQQLLRQDQAMDSMFHTQEQYQRNKDSD